MKIDRGTSAVMSQGFEQHDELPLPEPRDMKYREAPHHDRSNTQLRMNIANSRTRFGISEAKEFKLQELAMLSITPLVKTIQRWWLHRAERHYLICADVEQQRAREAQMNVAYYQKQAALARSARN